MITINKKAQESLITTKLISMVLLILVILALLMFLMKPQFLDWIRLAPGYETRNNTEIDLSQMSADQMASYGCIDRVALVGKTPQGKIFDRNMRDFYIIREGKNVAEIMNLSIDVGNSLDFTLEFKTPFYRANIVVGHIINDLLIIDSSFIKNYASSDLIGQVSLSDLKRIDNSTLFQSTANPYVLCKTK